MGTRHAPGPRAPIESVADEVPTQILSQRPGAEYGDDDGNTIELRNETTVRAEVNTEELRAKAPPLVLTPKMPRPVVASAQIASLDGENTEVGAVPRLVTIADPPEREEHTAIMSAPPPPTHWKAMSTSPVGMAPVPLSSSSSSSLSSPQAEDHLPYEVPGLESHRTRWKRIGVIAFVVAVVGVAGVAIGRLSAKDVAPAASSASSTLTPTTSKATATASPTATETHEKVPSPPPASEEEVDTAKPPPLPPPSPTAPRAADTGAFAPAIPPHVHAAPHPRPSRAASGPAGSGLIVRDTPF